MIEYLSRAWAIRPEVSRVIAASLTGAVSADEARALLGIESRSSLRSSIDDGQGRKIAILPLQGVIRPRSSLLALLFGLGGGGLVEFREQLRAADADPSVDTIVLNVDSPGGLTDLVPETAADIRGVQTRTVAVANVDAASAAYWLAAQADELVVTPSGQVGSIGVFTMHEDWSAHNAMKGIAPTYVSAGRFKLEGNPDAPLTDEAREAMQGMVDHFYGLFVNDVARGRGVTAQAVRDGFGEGRMAVADDAVRLGMADRVETLDVTLDRLAGEGPPRRSAHAHASAEPTVPAPGEPSVPAEEPAPEPEPEPAAPEPPAEEPAETPAEPDATQRAALFDALV